VDLETQALIGAEALKHLQQLDPKKLAPDTGKRVALALRQMGRVNQSQGETQQALDMFQRSRDVFAQLRAKLPERTDVIFELGNAEYYIGNLHNSQGRYHAAVDSMQKYHQLTGELVKAEPDNPDWIMELAYSHNNLAALEMGNAKPMSRETLDHIDKAVSLMGRVANLKPKDKSVADGYATVLAWAADTQIEACNIEQAMALRTQVRDLAQFASQSDPANNDLRRRYAFSVSGVASVQEINGQTQSAEQNLQQVVKVLEQLHAEDPSNRELHEATLYRRFMLARLLGDGWQNESARQTLLELSEEYLLAIADSKEKDVLIDDYLDLLLARTEHEIDLNNLETAAAILGEVRTLLPWDTDNDASDFSNFRRRTLAQYHWWRLTGEDSFYKQRGASSENWFSSQEFKSCNNAETAARRYVMDGEFDKATKEIAYLTAKGYSTPRFMRFCNTHGLCAN
jgi:tetratricopeptide (TPR) repeat protein